MTLPESLFRTLLEISLPMTAVIALLLLLRPLLKKHYRAKWMYWVWLLLAVRLVVPVNFALPTAPITVSNPGMTIYQRDTNRTLPGHSDLVLLTPERHADVVKQEAMQASRVTNPTVEAPQNEYRPIISLSQIAALVWGAGFCAVLLWEGVSYGRFRRRVRRWQSPLEDERFEALKAELGVKRLTLARCSAISSPMVTGFVHPTLLLQEYFPCHSEGHRPEESDAQGKILRCAQNDTGAEAVLRHELVHAKRRDLWYKLLLVFARAVHWFNPLVWLMARQASQDLELSCDEAVVAGRDEDFRNRYGKAILDAVDSGEGKEHAPLTTYFHGGKKAMLERLQSIVNTKGKRRGAIALALAAILAVSASAVCVINPPMQRVDGGSYTLNLPANITVMLTEEMPEGFNTSYYKAGFYRDGPIGSARILLVPGFATMTTQERITALDIANHLEAGAYTSPGGISGILARNTPTEFYYLSVGGNQVLQLYFYLGPKFDDFFEGRFTHDEIEATLSSIIIGSIDTPNPSGNFTLSVDFTENEALWYLWDTSHSPKLLGTANVPAKYRIWAAPLWSEDGKWAAVPSGDGGLRWNYRIFGIGKEGFEQDLTIALDPAALSKDYTPVPDTLELQAMKFVSSHADYPALALSYSLLDTEGNLQSGTLTYNCMPPEIGAALTGYTPVTDVEQNAPCVPTQWSDEIHTFSLLLPEGTVISSTDGTEAQIFTTPGGEEFGRIYKTAERPKFNSGGVRIQDGDATYLYSWRDPSHSLYYHLELRWPDSSMPLPIRMADSLRVDGNAVEFYYENQYTKPTTQSVQTPDYAFDLPADMTTIPGSANASFHQGDDLVFRRGSTEVGFISYGTYSELSKSAPFRQSGTSSYTSAQGLEGLCFKSDDTEEYLFSLGLDGALHLKLQTGSGGFTRSEANALLTSLFWNYKTARPVGTKVYWTEDMGDYSISLEYNAGGTLELVCAKGEQSWCLLALEYGPDHPYFSGLSAHPFTNVLGQDGFVLEHQEGSTTYSIDYYGFDQYGAPKLLTTCYNTVYELDINGDGSNELITNFGASYYCYIYTVIDGQVMAAAPAEAAAKQLGIEMPLGMEFQYDENDAPHSPLSFRALSLYADSGKIDTNISILWSDLIFRVPDADLIYQPLAAS